MKCKQNLSFRPIYGEARTRNVLNFSIKYSVTYELCLCKFNNNFNNCFGHAQSDACKISDTLKLKLENENDNGKIRTLKVEKAYSTVDSDSSVEWGR